jgi:SAM-dependent methyltransferase
MKTFSPFYAELYDEENATIAPEELARLFSYARRIQGPILEGMCGTGRFLIPLRAHNFRVDGLDICPFMLDICQKKMSQKALRASLYLQNIEQLDLPHRYDLIFILAKSLSMLKKERLASVFQQIYASLNPGAFFIFDLWGLLEPNASHKGRVQRQFRASDGSSIVRDQEFVYDSVNATYSLHNRYQPAETLAEETLKVQLYDQKEILQLLEKTGFSVLAKIDQAHFTELGGSLFVKREYWIECVKAEDPDCGGAFSTQNRCEGESRGGSGRWRRSDAS